jgi:hypothetical protein
MKTCSKCGKSKPANDFKERYNQCKSCINKSARQAWKDRIAAGLCGRCNEAAEPGKSYCKLHLERQRILREAFCIHCLKRPKKDGCSRCEECEESHRASWQRRRDAGLCPYCKGNPAVLPGSTRCETCLFKQKAMSHLGSSMRWREIKAIWDRQQGRCAYTGIPLDLVTADIDHKTPRAKRASGSPRNLQFVWRPINEMKKDHEESYFLSLVWLVSRHCKDKMAAFEEGARMAESG